MTISENERERRRQTLGASDLGAILGFALPYKTGADVQSEKLWPMVESENSGAARVGQVVEKALCEYAAEERKLESVVYSPPAIVDGVIHANLDALAPGQCVIEAKSTGRYDEWGTEGTDEVPDSVIVQAQVQLYVAKLELCLVPVLFTGLQKDVRLYEVRRDDDLIDQLVRMAEAWWVDHVIERRPVEAAPPTLDTLKRIKRQPKSFAVIDMGLVYNYKAAAAAAKAANDKKDEAQARLLAALGDAEAGQDYDGKTLVTYMERTRTEKPRLVEKVTTYRAMQIVKERDE